MDRIEKLVFKVEMVLVLFQLMHGKHKKRAQGVLADLKLIPGLSDLFDSFIWKIQGLVFVGNPIYVKMTEELSPGHQLFVS